MRENIRNQYFIILKLIGLGVLTGYQLINCSEGLMSKALHGLYLACFAAAAISLELAEERKHKNVIMIGEGILGASGVFLFPVSGIICFGVALADFFAIRESAARWYYWEYILLFIYGKITGEYFIGFCIITFIIVVYFQEKCVIQKYRSVINEEELAQLELKTDIERQTRSHQQEMKKSHLQFENQMLEDRNRISQALHDKLGHSINGSIYQLEAAKLMVEGRPQDCQNILQSVINQLRMSMDEIRMILRQERPNKRSMARLSLENLCEECQQQYNIKTRLVIEDEHGSISDKNWGIILDNTFEAVTNALKYAKCRKIEIEIVALNEVVRCTIKDDGKGAEVIEEGMGIAGMKDRVRQVKGYINISSEFGFTINMILPL